MDYTKDDIQSLIENKVPESRILDYKRECKLGLEQDKSEFIYDVCSFYNSDGGCIIYGLEEEKDQQGKNTGIPKLPAELVKVINYDQLKLQIEECIKQTTNPQIVNLAFSPLLEINGTNVFLLGIPKSSSLPAMVTYKNSGRFYKRKSTGKYQVDTYELFDLFTRNLYLQKEVTSFVEQRQTEVFDNRFWPSISDNSGLLMHIIPMSYYYNNLPDFSNPSFRNNCTLMLRPPGDGGYNHRYCFEGLHMYSLDRDTSNKSYSLLFRNAIIEAYTNRPFWQTSEDKRPWLDGASFLTALLEHVQNSIKFYIQYSIEPPYYLFIQLYNVQGFNLIVQESMIKRNVWGKSIFEFPPLMVNHDIDEVKQQVKQLADMLWQTGGESECPKTIFGGLAERLKF